MFDENELDDILYTFGVEKAGQLVLHNYPNELMKLKIPKHQGGEVTETQVIAYYESSVRRKYQLMWVLFFYSVLFSRTKRRSRGP